MAKFGASAGGTATTAPRTEDPYRYQLGFGNHWSSEAVPGALPEGGRNVPQRCPYDLFSEQLNGSPFVSTRANLQHVWMYRIRPSVAHDLIEAHKETPDIEACFGDNNPETTYTPLTYEWDPLEAPAGDEAVTFVDGIKTLGGYGSATAKEGVAMHMYAANASMENQAYCNNDGDFLVLPVQGRLDIQTELGRLMVRPGELCVIQAGIRFRVALPDGPVHGYLHEIFGTHFELPDLGVIGSNGLAHPRDFETPVAGFDMDVSEWQVAYKLAGKLYTYNQRHTPFDVVAWHGNYAPYKYAMEKFTSLVCGMKEQLDPTAYTVLYAKSKQPGVALSEFAVYTPKWIHAMNTYRPPYYHRNMSTGMLGMIYGKPAGSVRDIGPGCLSYESSYMPHGDSYDAWLEATTKELKPEVQSEESLGFMLHMGAHFSLTKFATERNRSVKKVKDGEFWGNMKGHFMDHLDVVNKRLRAQGLPALGEGPA
ncbi:hypothetical protein LTR85_000062 [Meristemomyces frigidus]|nr:hypothetical protein LTR85_000062 [Meristemomyces frigidus]